MIKKVEILPYHRMGEIKRIQMGRVESLPTASRTSEEQKQEWLCQLKAYGCTAFI